MEVIIERACGMEVHKDSITACIMTPKGKEIQTFSTKTVFLLQLIDWNTKILKSMLSHFLCDSILFNYILIINSTEIFTFII